MRRIPIPADCVAEVALAICSKSCSCDEDAVVTVDAVLAVDVEANVGVVQMAATIVVRAFVSSSAHSYNATS